MPSAKYYEVRTKIEREGAKGHWLRIGSGAAFKTDWGAEGVVCTIEATPLNWDGSFIVVPHEKVKEK